MAASNNALSGWKPYHAHVQGGLTHGNFVNGQFILICAGPPFFSQLSLGGAGATSLESSMVYPIGLTQNINLSQNQQVSRIFELGSNRSYFVTGRSVGQLGLGRVLYHGPSLLRTLYAYYATTDTTNPVRPLITGGSYDAMGPYDTAAPVSTGTPKAARSSGLHPVRVPPGYDNMFLNLASDIFSQPIGLMLVFMDNNENFLSSAYLEQAHIPNHNIAVEAQGLLVQEQCSIQYERLTPIRLTQLNLIDGVLPDESIASYSASEI